jgi:DNA polymerase-3 subunit epsilon
MSIEDEIFVCIDCESTGLDPKVDRIIEVAVVKFDLNTIHETYETLIDPESLIPESSIAIHHITQDMVQGKPLIKDVMQDLLKIIGRSIVVGHGVGFDVDLIATAAEKESINCTLRQNRILDTLRMARLYGDSPTNSLEQLRKHFNIEFEGAHRAMNDVIVNIEVFKFLAKKYKTVKQLFDILSRPVMIRNMPLGPHKGRPMTDVPLQYLLWAANKDFDQDLLYSIRSEINRRKKGGLFTQVGNPFAGL